MLTVRVFVSDPRVPDEREAAAIKRVQAAVARFPGRAELEVLDLDSDAALDVGVTVAPTVVVGDIVISVGDAPLAGQIKRFIETELEDS